jgi:murein DD-endopeptidase MepM/ murein hydrolase activator NlpD
MKLQLFYPLDKCVITQRFGENAVDFYKELKMLGHNGTDFVAPDGMPVRAAHDGRVTFAGYDDSAGLGVVIRTEEKFDYKDEPAYYKTIYWHLKKGTLRVTGSQNVKAGDIIGLADNTGKSTGSHLHFGLKPIYRGEEDWSWYNAEQTNGYKGAIDPEPFFNGFYAKDATIIKILKRLLELYQELLKALTSK